MSIEVRTMTDRDDLGALSAGYELGWIARLWMESDRDRSPGKISWFVGEVDGVAVGFGAALRAPAAAQGYGIAMVYVHPQHRRHGVGTALMAAIEPALREAGLPGMLVSWTEAAAGGGASAAAWGLRETARHRESVLDLTGIDRDDFAARAAAPGLLLTSLPPLDEVPEEHWQRLYGFFAARSVEAPDSAGGGEAPPYPLFRTSLTDPWSVVTIEEDGQLVTLTCVSRRAGTTDVANTMFTGVEPSARGRGLATAVKCHQALLMADAGITQLFTQNMDGNEPILAANRTLGFVVAGGYVDVVRDFASASS